MIVRVVPRRPARLFLVAAVAIRCGGGAAKTPVIGDGSSGGDDSDGADDWDDDASETVPCPHCRRPVYEDAEQCPAWPRGEQIRWHFDDPAETTGSEEQKLAVFRRVRNEIRQRIGLFLLANRIVTSAS